MIGPLCPPPSQGGSRTVAGSRLPPLSPPSVPGGSSRTGGSRGGCRRCRQCLEDCGRRRITAGRLFKRSTRQWLDLEIQAEIRLQRSRQRSGFRDPGSDSIAEIQPVARSQRSRQRSGRSQRSGRCKCSLYQLGDLSLLGGDSA